MGTLAVIAIRLLEILFSLGVVGSTVVLILSGIEDIEILIGSDKPEPH